jgi:hypothetical protein
VVFGSVNGNRRHYAAGVHALAQADHSWLERMITRSIPLRQWEHAMTRRAEDVKTVLDFVA